MLLQRSVVKATFMRVRELPGTYRSGNCNRVFLKQAKGNKLCQYRLKPTLQRHLAPYARRGIIGQNTVDLNSIRMVLCSPPKYKEVIFPSFRETGSRGSPGPRQQ